MIETIRVFWEKGAIFNNSISQFLDFFLIVKEEVKNDGENNNVTPPHLPLP